MDGGILNPVPIAPTFHDKTEHTIAVNLGAPVDPDLYSAVSQHHHENPNPDFRDKVRHFVEKLYKGESTLERSLNMYDVANQAFDCMQGSIARQKLAAYPPDFLIEVPRNACGILEFHKAERVIELGYAKAREFLQQNQHKF